jgi:predicted Zn-dependent protease
MPLKYALLMVLPLTLVACATSPTGHHQLLLLSQSQVDQMGEKAYQQERQKNTISHNKKINQFVDCVAHDILAVAKKQSDENYNWQVNIFKKNEANAFALPGGRLAVYTGILKYARTQGQLAAVLGHETGHVLAHHINARLSTAQLTQVGLDVASAFLGGGGGVAQRQTMALLGLGAQVGILLPYSRSQESEADIIGEYNMARAGFDPHQAIKIWQHFNAGNEKSPPVFLSDHPGNGQRIKDLQKHMDKAMKYYRQARAQGKHPDCGPAPPAPSG